MNEIEWGKFQHVCFMLIVKSLNNVTDTKDTFG